MHQPRSGFGQFHSQGPDRPHYCCVFLCQGAFHSFLSTPAPVMLPFCRFFHPLTDSLSLTKPQNCMLEARAQLKPLTSRDHFGHPVSTLSLPPLTRTRFHWFCFPLWRFEVQTQNRQDPLPAVLEWEQTAVFIMLDILFLNWPAAGGRLWF